MEISGFPGLSDQQQESAPQRRRVRREKTGMIIYTPRHCAHMHSALFPAPSASLREPGFDLRLSLRPCPLPLAPLPKNKSINRKGREDRKGSCCLS